jgi:hypothetical protein
VPGIEMMLLLFLAEVCAQAQTNNGESV